MNQRTYKIMIADDEYWTREKMRHMIPWEEYGLECLEPAADGEEVLQRMEQEIPDILITDINMPFMNGVDLLTEIQKRYPGVITFVISGYDDFEYVKGTFMAGAINYLMKPVTKIELVNAVSKALEMLSGRENEKQELLKAASLIQDREFSQLIERKELPFTAVISVGGGDLSGMSLMLVKIHNLQELMRLNHHDMNLLSYNVKRELRQLIGCEEGTIVFNYIYRSNEFAIVTELPEQELVRLAKKIRDYFSKFVHSPLTICISGHSYSMESIHMAYVDAIGLLMTRNFCMEDEILIQNSSDREQAKVNIHISSELAKQLKGFLSTGNRKGAAQVIFEKSGLFSCAEEGWSYLEVRQTLRQIMNILTEDIFQKSCHGQMEQMENVIELIDKKAEYLDVSILYDAMQDILVYLMPEQKEAASDSIRGMVRQAAAWIDEHYFEELTLTSFAEYFHVDSTYFSKVFRQEMGDSMIVYITGRRIEKAKEYMQNSDASLTEIAFMVGYDDYTYFNRVFRKNVGVSPREYRSLCRGEKE